VPHVYVCHVTGERYTVVPFITDHVVIGMVAW